jgi:hypothetical protein
MRVAFRPALPTKGKGKLREIRKDVDMSKALVGQEVLIQFRNHYE